MPEGVTHVAGPAPQLLRRADLAAAEAVGSLMELWGFRRQLGRIWAVLFLSERPLAAPELCERLDISTGLLSMSLSELREWGVVRGVEVPGDRKEHYQAETNVWRLVAHVLREREQKAVEAALATFDRLLSEVRGVAAQGDPGVRALARFKARRLELLAGLCHAALNVLRLLLDSARADVGPIKALSEVFGRRGQAPRLPPLAGDDK
jgi:HTH-type transcriptional regulator, glycine betaine synthesis regulator